MKYMHYSLSMVLSFCFLGLSAADDDTSRVYQLIHDELKQDQFSKITAMLASAKTDRLYIGKPGGDIEVWQMQGEPQKEAVLKGHKKVVALQLADDETLLFGQGSDTYSDDRIYIWDTKLLTLKKDIESRRLQSFFYDDQTQLLYKGGGRELKIASLQDINTLKLVGSYPGTDSIYNLRVADQRIYYCHENKAMVFGKLKENKCPRGRYLGSGRFEMDEQHIFAIASRGLSGSCIRVLAKPVGENDDTLEEKALLKGHTHQVINLAHIAAHHILCSSSLDKTIKLWNTRKLALIDSLQCVDIPHYMTASPDSIYAGYLDGRVQTWNIKKLGALRELTEK